MFLGRSAGRLSRLFGRGGSAIPGLIAEKIDPRVIEKLASTIGQGVVVVTGTNGKTTTTKMLVRVLESAGHSVVTNPTGSNLARGVATTLMETASWRGRVVADLAVFEIDEAAVRKVGPRLSPRLLVVTNLARDQLDRFGELATTAGHIRAAVEVSETVVLNADDPMVTALGDGRDPGSVRLFAAVGEIRAGMPSDSNLYADGGGRVDSPAADVLLERVVSTGDGQEITLRLPAGGRLDVTRQVPGAYNGYNAAAAALAALILDVEPGGIPAALESMPPAFGRGQVVEFSGKRVKILLVKNPAGFNQVIRLLAGADPGPVLVAINDLDADGRDVSWLWDARVEDLDQNGHAFGTSGIRAADMTLRLKYAGIDSWSDTDLKAALDRTVAAAGPGVTVHIVPTYTAMMRLLEILNPGRSAREVWT